MKTWNVTRDKSVYFHNHQLYIIAYFLYSRASIMNIPKMPLAALVSIGELTSVPAITTLTIILFLLALLYYVATLDHHFLMGRDLGKCMKIRKKRVIYSRWRRLKWNAVWCTRLTSFVWAEIYKDAGGIIVRDCVKLSWPNRNLQYTVTRTLWLILSMHSRAFGLLSVQWFLHCTQCLMSVQVILA